MVEVIYNSLLSLYKKLSNSGVISDKDITSLISLIAIQELITTDIRGYITYEEYTDIEKFLYCIFGSSCLIPYLNFRMNILHIGLTTELANRILLLENDIIAHRKVMEEEMSGIKVDNNQNKQDIVKIKSSVSEIKNTLVVKVKENIEDISDLP